MILVDANLLLYAYDETTASHPAAREWLEATLEGPELVRFAWVTLLAFLRIATNHRAGHEVADGDAEKRDDRDQRVAQHVYADDPPSGEALGLGRPDVVSAQVLGDGRTGQTDRGPQRERAEDDRRQDVWPQARLVPHRDLEDGPLDRE